MQERRFRRSSSPNLGPLIIVIVFAALVVFNPTGVVIGAIIAGVSRVFGIDPLIGRSLLYLVIALLFCVVFIIETQRAPLESHADEER